MGKWVRIENGVVVEVTGSNPSGRFHGSLIWQSCTDSVAPGWSYANGIFSSPQGPSLQEQKDRVWEEIKATRLDRWQNGGFKVQVSPGVFKWFHSDVFSRTQQLGLVIAGAACPSVQWKTMDGSFVLMTPAIAQALFAAGAATDTALFTAAEQHRSAAWALQDPLSYTGHKIDAGWPDKYQE